MFKHPFLQLVVGTCGSTTSSLVKKWQKKKTQLLTSPDQQSPNISTLEVDIIKKKCEANTFFLRGPKKACSYHKNPASFILTGICHQSLIDSGGMIRTQTSHASVSFDKEGATHLVLTLPTYL